MRARTHTHTCLCWQMLDELKLPAKKAFAGFPDHPHRGFETCSIMLEGEIEHKDSVGNQGVIGPGGVQWMTAGRGGCGLSHHLASL